MNGKYISSQLSAKRYCQDAFQLVRRYVTAIFRFFHSQLDVRL